MRSAVTGCLSLRRLQNTHKMWTIESLWLRKGTRTLTHRANWKLRTLEFLLETKCCKSMTNITFFLSFSEKSKLKVKRKRFTFLFACRQLSSVRVASSEVLYEPFFSDFNGHSNGLRSIKQALTWRSRKLIARKEEEILLNTEIKYF